MGEYLDIDPERQIKLKGIISKLHAGKPAAEVRKEFQKLIHGVSAAEVAAMEQSLIDGGMPVEEVQRLCEVHVQVFENSLAKGSVPAEIPGHPVQTLIEENKLAKRKAKALKSAARAWAWKVGTREAAVEALADLSLITVHYTRKENQLFPFLEKHGFTGPSRVMWGKHDEIRAVLKEAQAALDESPKKFLGLAKSLATKINRMIFMEEHILIPESTRKLSEREWAQIRSGEAAIGFAWISPASMYDPAIVLARTAASPALASSKAAKNSLSESVQGLIDLSTGQVRRDLLDIALTRLPADISIVDENDKVLYYSDSPHRLFPRSPAAIGRSVQNCHPQKSVDTVNRILAAFKNKEKDKARFWIEMGGKFILIEYHALYDKEGAYRGTLEFSQDLTELRSLTGQRRLLDWD